MIDVEVIQETPTQRRERICEHLAAILWWLKGRASTAHDAMIGSDLPWSYLQSLAEAVEIVRGEGDGWRVER